MSEQRPGPKRSLPPAAIVGIVLAALCGLSLYIRIHLPFDHIFVNDLVWFRETDAFYYMRHIENMVQSFPRFNAFDPYMLYPGGSVGLPRPFFAWLVAGMALLVGGGSPTQHTIATVGAYMPAILGALTIIPVYFIGRELFNRWVGGLAAALIAILPGEFMNRSLLGFTDHHVAETLFSTTAILFLIMAVKRAREREISFDHLRRRDWATIRKPLIYTLLAGVFLGFYLLGWQGGLMFIFVIFAYLVVQFIVDHLRRKSTDYLCIIGTPLFLIAFLLLLPVLGAGAQEIINRVSLAIAITVPVVLSIISRLLARRAWKPAFYPLAVVGLAGIGLAALYAINPSLLQSMLRQFDLFAPAGARLTILEMQPLTASLAWANFTTSFFIAFVAFVMLAFATVRERSADKTLFLVWSIIMLVAVLGQRRFGYYYAVNVALLTGYFSWKMLDLAGLKKLLAKTVAVVGAVKEFKKRKKGREKAKPRTFMQPRGAWVRVIVVAVAIFFLVFFPNIGRAQALAAGPHLIGRWLAEGWYESCLWLRDNSPEPFGDPDFYYQPYETPFQYPDTAYGVMSWWDYGYFIMQIGRRIPNSNPGQAGAVQAGQFFTAQDESSANHIADGRGAKYVVIDHMMATGKFYAMAEWADKAPDEFYERYYYQTEDGRLQTTILYYPAYYNSTAVRLYYFDGQAVDPVESTVVSYEQKVDPAGTRYKQITGSWQFPTYQEAEDFVAGQETGDYSIVGVSPLASIVPLEAWTSYELAHQSRATITLFGQRLPGVKIFEYLGPEQS